MNNIPYFDSHCDTISKCAHKGWELREHVGQLDLMRLKEYKKAVQFFAIFHNLARCPADGMFAECKRQQQTFVSELAKNADLAVQCRTAADIRKANAEGKIAAVLTCEGTELLNCDPANLEWAEQVGIRAINLTWNHPNFISGTNLYETDRGLNDLGKEFVRRTQEKKILIDVSHVSDKGFWDLMDITTRPVLASHSNARAICDHSRNLTDDMFKAIVQTGGMVGVNYWVMFINNTKEGATMDEFIRHIDHFMELGGEKNVGLGSDLDGCAKLPGDMQGVQDVTMLWEALSKHGYSDALLEDIFYNNYLAMLERNEA